MKTYTAVVEQCADIGLYVGYVPGFPGAHSQAATLEELNRNLREVVETLLEDLEDAKELGAAISLNGEGPLLAWDQPRSKSGLR
jgi:predicted RNase H-like HicB family nuclease